MHLSEITHPNQLHGLSIRQLQQIARQIREKHLQTIAASGGHLGPGLGVVELTLALYQTLDLDRDKVIWDVGHQAYPHKLITGRYSEFHTLRQKDGVAGYLKRCESKFDHFGAGHASTSISAALGMALARDLKGDKFKVAAIIGDGALTGGMALEAINHAGHLPKTNLLVILNDNEMSISPNVGAISRYLNKMRLSAPVQFLADNLEEQVKHIPFVGESLTPELHRLKGGMKRLAVSKVGAIIEELGFTYLGPVDGHNLAELIATFEQAHHIQGPVLVHVATVKGKGYEIAEKDQVGYHAQSPFDLTTGKAIPSSKPKPPGYSKVFAHTLVKLAENNPKIIGITAAMATGTGLDKLASKLPKQYVDVGIAEQHAVTLGAGLACEGMRPVVAIYSTFLQRAYDQIVHDVCIQNLPVFFCMDRAGIVGSDGPTHQGMYDIAYLRCLPNMVLMAPKDEAELQQMVVTGVNYTDGPIAMRYPRGNGYGVPLMEEGWESLPIGKGEILRHGDDLLLIGFGAMVHPAMQVAEILREHGIEATVINARFAKPLDTELILPLAKQIGRVVTLEEGCLMGGFGSAVAEALLDANVVVPVKRIGIPDTLVDHAEPNESKADLGLTSPQIAETVRQAFFSQQLSPVGS
ncbi:MAG: 1-deoxy-D-xylulose-5-phosphate synthase [Chroococcidiopsis cubana SAG 39.79]|jgi:1-deoxy-D-xylulose-5-phosphate synthase|uniref:1-deoxy-D-xylulose-5-phosphate synthase n=1 Tax=Chroococcidiopsis cubana SAG 39.79 TaxID=388085 RepID=A0AB37UMC8_9CYAN|nr:MULTISPECIES: 1-deoxy-D-xylulose-5-phosphate synthase [Chroococcidiopsis]MBE9016675.1 1-deoxy-D-xylulose-5-phosphate synthase [Chroococcidiopsidales cyanobacterium LEGE 13417]PSB44070.1 1-deoxy-D-xylulose-5-phosphate synthase [Cyanosarcina cf. burmensis CCALA 770]MDZ4878659.1 1-deoxy-D-xylulose-5-phosphate synthase [Chroococcidiopsis cubana SAG 39.79]PSB63177.1 1-deoxy-D-xylulose-5-phosphate synthase [Chroococcidiopsis cubana CCALA 043]PSM47203.1 1-deoxy-D-xylulose-5-phosphate synthase [Chr